MTKTLKRIAPVKFGIVVGIFYGLFSLIFIPFFILSLVAASLAPSNHGTEPQGLTMGLGAVFMVILPIMYAVLGGLFGMLAAWLYNVIASWVGGIEFEVS